ncbi:hypothetical protein CDAR_218681 [Caerostris darwini]|uniref:Uncharacterized protein n=1 Tax=Caerostris darwini TaxID=1538125 RepID=A0AAV4UG27_9ARAC|nr:hypothetical protein CDAR_218681 [Caerostris darwini]
MILIIDASALSLSILNLYTVDGKGTPDLVCTSPDIDRGFVNWELSSCRIVHCLSGSPHLVELLISYRLTLSCPCRVVLISSLGPFLSEILFD